MSIHSSLKLPSGKTAGSRNVMKRFERLRHLITNGRWTTGESVFGLPKIRPERRKIKKAAPKEAAPAAEGQAAATPAAK